MDVVFWGENMFTPKIVEVKGRLVARGVYTIQNAKMIYEYLDFETSEGRFKIGKTVVSFNVGKHVEIGQEGTFVFTRYLGRALALVISEGNIEINPMFKGGSILHLLFPLALFLVGLFFAPLWLIAIPIWAFALYLLVLPSLVISKLKTIVKEHGVAWSTAKKKVDF